MNKRDTKAERIKDLNRWREHLLDLLCALIRIPSVKGEAEDGAPFGRATRAALRCFLDTAERDGFRTGELDGYAGYIDLIPEAADAEKLPLLAAACHLDVVPPGDWAEAFTPRFEGVRLLGRGSIDDKGPAVAAYGALLALKSEQAPLRSRVRLILGLDEESGSACMAHYRQHAELPSAAFTPDGDFPVIHAEKGVLHLTLRLPCAQKPEDKLRLLGAKAGTRLNVVPERCDLAWSENGERREKIVTGRAAHASTPEQGENAISLAMRQAADKLNERHAKHPLVDFYQQRIGMETNGKSLGLALSDSVSGALTCNIGTLKLDEREARLGIDIRYPVTMDGAEILDKLRQVAATVGGDCVDIDLLPPLYLPLEHPLVSGLLEVYAALSGTEAQALAIGGGTYARELPNTVAFGAVFPGETALMHQEGEFADVESLLDSVNYYYGAFKKMDEIYGAH